ncbi:MAG: hypothetical protein COB39_06830 [Marinosulfonomonas sp.]|nr:MAG: hypothetical protein COB39_06830 [Marinosulfonomonas sp.]
MAEYKGQNHTGYPVNDTQVFETENVRVTCYDASLPRMVVSFDIWRKDRSGFPPPKPSGFYKQNGLAYLTIQSAHNDWYLSTDLPKLRKILSRFTKQFDHITALGFSMGGYGALLLSRALHLNQVVLVSPQSSIFPARAPFDDRYLQEAMRLDPALDTLAEYPRRGLRGVLLYDPSDMIDTQHTAIITGLYPNIIATPLPFGGHPATQAITQANLFAKIQHELLRRPVRAREFIRLHKQARRHSPVYQNRLSRYLADRNARAP